MNVIESCVRSGKNETVKFVGGRSKGNILTIREGIFKSAAITPSNDLVWTITVLVNETSFNVNSFLLE